MTRTLARAPRSARTLVPAALSALPLLAASFEPTPPPPSPPAAPFALVSNAGQWPANEAFRFAAGAMYGRLVPAGLDVVVVAPDRRTGVLCTLRLAGAEGGRWVAGPTVAGRHHFVRGSRRHVATRHAAALLQSARPGLELRVHGEGGMPKYDLLVDADTALGTAVFVVDGHEGIALAADGALRMQTAHGTLRQPAPVAWEVDAAGARHRVAVRFAILGPDRFGFEAPDRTPGRRLVVDPGLEWSTFFGGTTQDVVRDAHVAPDGTTTLAGSTYSATFPTTAGAFRRRFVGVSEAFVSRFDGDGKLQWSTYLGGRMDDEARAVDIAPNGDVVVAGITASPDFPTTAGAFATTPPGSGDVFVVVLDARGSTVRAGTFLGGTDWEECEDVVVAPNGDIVVGGWTKSRDMPTSTGAHDRTYNGNGDAFVHRFDAGLRTLVGGTHLGGVIGWDTVAALGFDTSHATPRVVVAGETWGSNGRSDFPTTSGAYDSTYNGDKSDTYLAWFDARLTTLAGATLLGGNSWDPVRGLAVDGADVLIAGESWSNDFPVTANAAQRTYGGRGDAFVARFRGATRLLWSTFHGGSDTDGATALAVDPIGLTVAGNTKASDMPTTPGALDRTYGGKGDAFVMRLSPDGARREYATHLGGSGYETPTALGVDARHRALLAGEVYDASFPTTAGAYDTSYNGGGDVFVARLELLATGVTRRGNPTRSCAALDPYSMATGPAVAGSTVFGVATARAAAGSRGAVLVYARGLQPGLPILGIELLVDVGAAGLVVPAVVDAAGVMRTPLPLAGVPRGARAHVQFVWANTASCGGLGTLGASDALDIVVQ